MWFGRALPFRVSEVGDEGDTMRVVCNELSKPIMMATRNDGTFLMSSLLIVNQVGSESNFIQGVLVDIF